MALSPDFKKTEAASLRRSIGVVIRTLRDRKRLTQNELAVASGLTRVYIGRIERGDMNASIDSMLMICTALSTSLLHVLALADTRVFEEDDS
ncbi:helix-turn-helix domain-containing protein [Paraburkholderia steynii]|uniref:helix-turn-helix domain-containing protein n=1 Tax=Paraburkholderia steynii TaxID=1245441 RepID=UPI001FC9B95B|nr:helix-turn-helix transcriptional regulator [Paraburkholderia steynii]